MKSYIRVTIKALSELCMSDLTIVKVYTYELLVYQWCKTIKCDANAHANADIKILYFHIGQLIKVQVLAAILTCIPTGSIV